MRRGKKSAFRREMDAGRSAFWQGDLTEAFRHLERAHILGQRWLDTHLSSHWWMLRVAIRRRDGREVRGQLRRLVATFPGYAFGWVPKGNTGGADVNPLKSMPIPEDLQIDLGRYSVTLDVLKRLLFWSLIAAVAFFEADRRLDASRFEARFREKPVEAIENLGSVQRLEIIPLVNWHADDPDLQTEAGVSYLVRADDLTILFDLGLNAEGQSPSPVLANMAALGIAPAEIDAVFLSHAHLDHVGGKQWAGEQSFALSPDQRALAGKTSFAPVRLTHPAAHVDIVDGPRALWPGIASTGPIGRRLFAGAVEEQALVVNVEGLGLVAIVGCGHQTVPKLLARIDAAFDGQLFGIIGDLHYPVPEGRLRLLGIDAQRRLASGGGPLSPISAATVTEELTLLSEQLGVLALGGHDTSDAVLAEAEAIFGARYRRVVLGEPIVIEAASPPSPGSSQSSP